jgi:hypothetical protein
MLADYSVELGPEDPALELPWRSDDPAIRYFDLKRHPELLCDVPEAAAHPELAAFLGRVNAPEFPLETAKCDAWASQEILPEEEIFDAEYKFASYVDLIFCDPGSRLSFEQHEALAKNLCKLLKHAPDIAASIEFMIRRCYYHREQAGDSMSGFYITAYVNAFGQSEEEARKQWTIALALAQNALVQVAKAGLAADERR